jgi:6-phosphogluconolactonase
MTQQVRILDDTAALIEAAAVEIAAQLKAAIAARGRAALVLSGGSAPPAFLGRLAVMPADEAPRWADVSVMLADERYVPGDHDDSNGGMVRRTLLNYVTVPADAFFPMATYYRDAARAAEIYAQQTDAVLQAHGGLFDLVVLGMGPDGHTASLFPQHAALQLPASVRAAVIDDSPKPPARRITLTAPTLAAARRILYVVSGADKAAALARALRPQGDGHADPTRLIVPADGTVTWLVDRAAAAELPRSAD